MRFPRVFLGGVLLLAFAAEVHAEKLTIASWNFGSLAEEDGRGCFPRESKDYGLLRKYLDRLNADVIAFQEVESAIAAERVFDPDAYEIIIAEDPREPARPSACRGQPGQFLTPQKVGFAIRRNLKTRGISYMRLPDLEALAIKDSDGGAGRAGVEIAFDYKGTEFRILAVHLKSGCNKQDPPNRDTACGILWQQRQILEDWIDDNVGEGRRTIIVGDFNRQLTRHGDPFWASIDDSNPPGSDLELVASNGSYYCGPFQESIDHIVVDKGADQLVDETSFRVLKFDEPWERAPAHHCPVVVTLDVDTGVDRGYRWVENSVEFRALTEQIYKLATTRLKELVAARGGDAKPWVVVLDVDETLLSNLEFERASRLQFRKFSLCRLESWVKEDGPWATGKKAQLIPGALDFLKTAVSLGGKVALITNRPAFDSKGCQIDAGKPVTDLNAKTRETLKRNGIDLGPDTLCVLGQTPDDTESNNQEDWKRYGYKNDKDHRRRLVRQGEAADCWSGHPDERLVRSAWGKPHDILMALGDNVQDFDTFTQEDLKADPAPLREVLGDRFFLLPNPLYGSWQ